jgi:hypothetical protein
MLEVGVFELPTGEFRIKAAWIGHGLRIEQQKEPVPADWCKP